LDGAAAYRDDCMWQINRSPVSHPYRHCRLSSPHPSNPNHPLRRSRPSNPNHPLRRPYRRSSLSNQPNPNRPYCLLRH
jgi:hypothetical protein